MGSEMCIRDSTRTLAEFVVADTRDRVFFINNFVCRLRVFFSASLEIGFFRPFFDLWLTYFLYVSVPMTAALCLLHVS